MMFRNIMLAALCGLALSACKDDDDDVVATPRAFTVTITNVSTPNTISSDRAMGTVPLSPPAYAVFTGTDPFFRVGERANLGTARIAEDGFPEEMISILMQANNVKSHAAITSPGGPDNGPAVFAGESVTFTVMAVPGDKLQFETMFVQSNDWFYSFRDGGLELFTDNTPISGDMTSRLEVYDAGTEADTAPGTGPMMEPGPVQKPVQDPMATNVGTDEDVPVQVAATRHPSFTIPVNSAVIRVMVVPN